MEIGYWDFDLDPHRKQYRNSRIIADSVWGTLVMNLNLDDELGELYLGWKGVKGDMADTYKWMKGFNIGVIIRVLKISSEK